MKWAKQFYDDQEGSVGIEVILWMIMMLGIVGIIVDASAIFYSHSEVLRTLQDGNRNLSVRRFDSTDEIEQYIETQLARLSSNVVATSSLADISLTSSLRDRVVTTVVNIPTADLGLLGFFEVLNGAEIKVTAQYYIEDIGS
jgi:Flp pilus assembly protein TadG